MRIVHYGDFMTRLIDRLNLLSQLGLIVIIASSCMYATPVLAFHGASEQPTPDEPVIEEDDESAAFDEYHTGLNDEKEPIVEKNYYTTVFTQKSTASKGNSSGTIRFIVMKLLPDFCQHVIVKKQQSNRPILHPKPR